MEWFWKNKVWLIGLSLSIISAILRFMAADQTEHPTGWDGYYYVMQVHSWLTYGYLQSPDFSLIYPYFTAITWLVGDFILGFKVGVALLSGILVGSVYFYLYKRTGCVVLICIVCSYLIFSPLITYFLLQFPKNALGLVFLIFFIYFTDKRWLAIVFLIATVLTHRMTGGFALIAIALYLFRSVSWKWIIGGIALVALIGLLPGVIHISDLQRFSNQLTIVPHWAPFAFYKLFSRSLSALFLADLILVSLIIPFVLYLVIKNRKQLSFETLVWIAVAVITIFPFFEFSPGSAGHRFFLVAPVAFIMILPLGGNPPKWMWAFVAVFLGLSAVSYRSYNPRHLDPPNRAYSNIVDRLVERYDPHNYPLVIAHQSLAEMIIFRTDFDALNWLPPDDMQPQHVLRIINGLQISYFRKYLEEADYRQIRSISRGYFAAPEDVWQRFVQAASKDNNQEVMKAIYSDFNPMAKRPYFINKGKIR
jgi:hypothetical protein